MRLQNARHNANYLHEQLGFAMPGFAFVNFVKARKLRPLQLDLPRASLVHPSSTDPNWAPPKGAIEFIERLAQLVTNWRIERGDNAGEKWRGLRASNQEIADALGIHPNQWRRKAYFRDGKRVAMPGTREWLEHHELLRTFATTERRVRPHRDGVARSFGEGTCYYEPGRALLELLGIHGRRVRRYRMRIAGAVRRQLRDLPGRQTLSSKGSGDLISVPEIISPSHRARAHGRKVPIVRQQQLESPVGEGVGAKTHRRAPAAPPADRRHAPCTSGNRQEPEGSKGQVASVGGDDGTPYQLERPLGASHPPAGDASTPAASSEPSREYSGDDAGEPVDVKALLSGLYAKLDPHGHRRTEAAPPAPPRSPPPPDERRVGDVIAGFGDTSALVEALGASARRREAERAEWRCKRGVALGEEQPRTPDEEAENERRRRAALERARLEAGDATDDDDNDGGAA